LIQNLKTPCSSTNIYLNNEYRLKICAKKNHKLGRHNEDNETLNNLNRLLDIYPNNLCLLKIRAEEYYKLNKHNEALNDLNRLLDIYPNNLYLLKIRAKEFRKLGRFIEALKDLNRLLDIYLNDKDVLRFHREVMIDISTELLKMHPNNEHEISNSLSNYFEDPHLENASAYFEQKPDTTWGLLDFLQFRKKQKTWTKNKDVEFNLFNQCLLANTKNMKIAIQTFMIRKFENKKKGPHIKGIFEDHPIVTLSNNEKSQNFKLLVSGKFGTSQWKLESGNTLQETLASYWKNKWNEFNNLDFDDPFVSGIIYLPFLPWLNELLSTEDTIELKNDSSFIHQLTNDWWLPYFQKIQSKNKNLVLDHSPYFVLDLMETRMYEEPDPLLNEGTWRHDAYDLFKYLLDPLISQNKKNEHVMKLKRYWAEATLDASTERKTKAQNKTIRGRMVDFVLRLKSAENKSLELFVCEIAGGLYNLKSDKILSDKLNKLHQIKVYAAIGF
ncbi:46286_t:CDS:2, partial [Gigaspora margarita]